jgi:hypothetical protein
MRATAVGGAQPIEHGVVLILGVVVLTARRQPADVVVPGQARV